MSGFEVAVAYDGREASQQARRLAPSAAVLDINMPVMDGYQAARTIRSSSGRSIVLVALTARSAPEDLRAADAAGFDAHVVKPVAGGDLVDLLQESIERRATR